MRFYNRQVENENFISTFNKFGINSDIDTADTSIGGQKIWPIKNGEQEYLFIDTPKALFIKSSSLDDSAIGTGARTVEGMHHDSLGIEQEFTATLNGTANVALFSGLTSFGVFRFGVETSGSGNVNAGRLDIVDGSGNIYSTMSIGEGQTQIAVLRIPNNRTGLIKYARCNYSKTGGNQDAEMRLKVRKVDGTIRTKLDPTITTANIRFEKTYRQKGDGIAIGAGEWVFWECILTSANDTPIGGYFDGGLFST